MIVTYPSTPKTASATTSPPKVDADTVQTNYLGLLGRPAEPTELAFWSERIGVVQPDFLIDLLLAPSEFVNSFAGGSDEDFVRSLQFNLFDRNISQPELDAFFGAIGDDEADRGDLHDALLDQASESDADALGAELAIANYVTDAIETGGYIPDTLTRPDTRSSAELYSDLFMLDME